MEPYIPTLSEPARSWVRFAGLMAALALLCWIAYGLRTVFTPLLVAAALAYILNPLVTWVERARRVRRLTIVTIAFAVCGALLLGGGFYAGSRTIAQVAEFQRRLPAYVETVGEWVALARSKIQVSDLSSTQVAESRPPAGTPAGGFPSGDDWWRWAAPVLKEHGATVAGSIVDHVAAGLSNVLNWVSLLVLIPVFTFYFLWRFNDFVGVLHDHLPGVYRDRIVHAACTIDGAVASFFRGRLLVCLAVGVLTGIGWTIVGVPYSLPLGVLAGTLNLVPFMSLLAVPPAMLLTFLAATEAGAPWLWPVLLAAAVYMIVQALESFLLSPAIEGQASGLHPLAIVVALMIGAQLAGLLGMLLAIPVASILKTFAAELVLPELRRLAAKPAEPADPGGGA